MGVVYVPGAVQEKLEPMTLWGAHNNIIIEREDYFNNQSIHRCRETQTVFSTKSWFSLSILYNLSSHFIAIYMKMMSQSHSRMLYDVTAVLYCSMQYYSTIVHCSTILQYYTCTILSLLCRHCHVMTRHVHACMHEVNHSKELMYLPLMGDSVKTWDILVSRWR